MLNVPDTVPTGSATGNPRNKIALKKGRGLMDWVRLGHTVPDLAGTGGKILKITSEELSKHNKKDDAWIALKGNVYNVTPYMEYHPGGPEELMKGAGKDGTDLFNSVHKWVNFQSMLQKCLIGNLVETKPLFSKPNFLPLMRLGKSADTRKENYLTPSAKLLVSDSSPKKFPAEKSPLSSTGSSIRLPSPKYDWFQTKAIINFAIYTKWKDIRKWHVIVVNDEEYFKTLVYINDQVFTVYISLLHQVDRNFDLKVAEGTGKVDILLLKSENGVRWPSIGKTLPGNNEVVQNKNKEVEFLQLEVLQISQVTHNTILMEIKVPDHIHFQVPCGHHVYLKVPESDIVKPYTPVIVPFSVSNAEEKPSSRNIKIFFKVYSDGGLSSLLGKLSVGDRIDASFPEGSFSMNNFYQATKQATYLVLLGAGTGITPLVRLMLEALKNEVKTILVLFNRTEKDIPWKVELNSLVVTQSKLLRVTHVLSSPSSTWKSYKGHIRRDLLEEMIPFLAEDESIYICLCGTVGFTSLTLSLLEEMGHGNDITFAFTG